MIKSKTKILQMFLLTVLLILSVTVVAAADSAYTVFLPSGSGFETVAVAGYGAQNIVPGGECRFTLTLKEGYTDSTSSVYADGVLLTAENGIYSITDIKSNINVTVTGVTKNTYRVALPSAEKYALVAAPGYNAGSVLHGSAFKFTLQLKKGYLNSQPVVKNGNEILTPDFNGVYTLENVTADNSSLTADNFTRDSYTITFKNTDGSVLLSTFALYGDTPVYDATTPVQEASAQYVYTWSGWTPALRPADGEIIYTAVYSQSTRNYTVRFENFDGKLVEEQSVPFGGSATCDIVPVREPEDGYAYGFIGWSHNTSVVTSDMTVTARYEHVHTYRILTFAPTCTEPGYSMKICTACHYNLTYDYISAPGHSFGAWTEVTPASETETGLSERICSVCGERETEEIPAGTPGETTSPAEPDKPDEPDEPQENSFIAALRAFFEKIIAFIKSIFIK